MNLSARVGKSLRWQTFSASRSWTSAAGPAGRRLAALFSVGLARSFDQRGSADRTRVADRTVAASLHESLRVVAQESAAQGGVGGGKMFKGADERASKEGVCSWVMKSRATPGPAWQRGGGEHPARSHRLEIKGRGDVVIFSREVAMRRCRAGSKFHFLTTGCRRRRAASTSWFHRGHAPTAPEPGR